MKITTETGAVYDIHEGICVKTSSNGDVGSPFKVWQMTAVDDEVLTYQDVFALPPAMSAEVGKRMYISGKDEWWVSTRVTGIEGDE
jgi:hypothetical protein